MMSNTDVTISNDRPLLLELCRLNKEMLKTRQMAA